MTADKRELNHKLRYIGSSLEALNQLVGTKARLKSTRAEPFSNTPKGLQKLLTKLVRKKNGFEFTRLGHSVSK